MKTHFKIEYNNRQFVFSSSSGRSAVILLMSSFFFKSLLFRRTINDASSYFLYSSKYMIQCLFCCLKDLRQRWRLMLLLTTTMLVNNNRGWVRVWYGISVRDSYSSSILKVKREPLPFVLPIDVLVVFLVKTLSWWWRWLVFPSSTLSLMSISSQGRKSWWRRWGGRDESKEGGLWKKGQQNCVQVKGKQWRHVIIAFVIWHWWPTKVTTI
jgi:hypothetical protein